MNLPQKGAGPNSGGQSGDTQGLPEDIEELVEEGQYFEAETIDGVENAPDADQGGVRTREVPEDDVPAEYLNEESPKP